jgi:flagellar motor switch protein FliN/FliY
MAQSDVKGEIGADEWAAAAAGTSLAPSPARAEVFPELKPESGAAAPSSGGLDMILDIPVQLTIELGRTKLPIRELLHLAQGSVVELDRLAGEPLDVLVNGTLVAQGEVVVVNDKFGIRLTDVIGPDERLRRLQR